MKSASLIAKGFTLIELMIVVAIIGILAAVAIVSYGSSVRDSRTAEATNVLMTIAASQEAYFSLRRAYVEGGDNPATAPANEEPATANWAAAGWVDLNLSGMETSQYFQYKTFGWPTSAVPAGGASWTDGGCQPELATALAAALQPWFTVHAQVDWDGGGADWAACVSSQRGGRVVVYTDNN